MEQNNQCVYSIASIFNCTYIFRYLDGYERLYFLGEDNDDTSSSRVSLWNLGGYGQQQMPMMLRSTYIMSRYKLAIVCVNRLLLREGFQHKLTVTVVQPAMLMLAQ